ncbi:MAG: aryl-sulfate sulfotransferase [Chloroflexota bacterium]
MGWSAYRKTGLTYHNPHKSFKGFTLFSPPGSNSTVLINMAGQVVKQWQFDDFRPGFGKLLPSGNLMVTGSDPALVEQSKEVDEETMENDLAIRLRNLGGGYTILREYDFDGNLLWSYDNPAIHHDFHLKENGHILFPEWVALSDDFAKNVRGGIRSKRKNRPPMLGDDIIEINRNGDIVARHHTWQYLDPRRDPIQPLEYRGEWTHLNGLDVMPDGKIVISCRNISRVAIIDPETETLLWKLTEDEISMQHSVTCVGDGNVQIFDNGMSRPFGLPYSRVIEVDPNTSKVVWEYKANPTSQFFSGHISNAQRLEMGNVFICEGTSGRLFEVTRNSEIVWEWVTPFVSGSDEGKFSVAIYRAYRYGLNHPAVVNRNLSPDDYKQLNVSLGLM